MDREEKRRAFEDGYKKAMSSFAHLYASTNDVAHAFSNSRYYGDLGKLYAGWTQEELDQESYERAMRRN